MEFVDDGIILGARAHGEAHAVVDILTAERGRWTGFVYGGQSRKTTPVLQPGNGVRAAWKGRVDESLGHFTLELTDPRAARLLDSREALAALNAATSVTLATLVERVPHPRLFAALSVLLGALDTGGLWLPLIARYELGLLGELGFGLSLDKCVSTGATDRLIYVSPRSGAAVSEAAGEPYRSKLLPLPAFLLDAAAPISMGDITDALTLTGAFLEARILHPASKELPEARKRLFELVSAEAQTAPAF